MTKTEYQHLQVAYMREATLFYREKNTAIAGDTDSGRSYNRLLKNQRRSMQLKRLRTDLKDISPDSFVKSTVPCNCNRPRIAPHFKLKYGDILECPIVLGIQWARWNLVENIQIDFDIRELIERAK